MNDTNKNNIEAMFTSKEEIDTWYEQTVDGLAKTCASVVHKHGIDFFNDNSLKIYQAILELNSVKHMAYMSVLDRKPTGNEFLQFPDIYKKYLILDSDPN